MVSISFVNWKGGVGKSTTVVNVAAELAYTYQYRVLVVDLDPQGTSSFYLYTPRLYETEYLNPVVEALKMNRREEDVKKELISKSSYGLVLSGSNEFVFNVDAGIKRGVAGISRLDLIPATHFLLEMPKDITLRSMRNGSSPFEWLYRGISYLGLWDKYDFILFDCPPNLDLGTQNAVFASDYYIIPTIPDTLSSTGIILLVRSIYRIKRRKRSLLNKDSKLLGILFTMVSHQLRGTQTTWMNEIIPIFLQRFKDEKIVWDKAVVFNTRISYRVAVQKAASESKPLVISSERRSTSATEFASLAKEIIDYLKLFGDLK